MKAFARKLMFAVGVLAGAIVILPALFVAAVALAAGLAAGAGEVLFVAGRTSAINSLVGRMKPADG